MKTLNLKVTIEGGESFTGIYYYLYKKEEIITKGYSKNSFEKEFINLEGEYALHVLGTNPISKDRKTTVKLYFNDNAIVLDKISKANPSVQKSNSIAAFYYFKTMS